MVEYSLGAIPFDEQHTAHNIERALRVVFDEKLDCKDLFPVLTTDGAANMRKAGNNLKDVYWIRCFLHVMHCAIEKGFKAI